MRKNKTSLLKIALVIIILGVASWLIYMYLQNSGVTGLQVESGDQAVQVMLDGEFLGPTPFYSNQLTPGQHVITLQPVAAEYLSYDRPITLTANYLTVIEWHPATTVERSWGIFYEPSTNDSDSLVHNSELAIASAPDNVVVRLNDGDPEATPQVWSSLAADDYRLNFSLPGYESLSRNISLAARTKINVFVKLARFNESLLQETSAEDVGSGYESQLRPSGSRQVAGATMKVLSTGTYQDRKEVLTLRTQPDANSPAALVVTVGSQLTYLGDQQNGFYKVQSGQKAGWAPADSVRFQ